MATAEHKLSRTGPGRQRGNDLTLPAALADEEQACYAAGSLALIIGRGQRPAEGRLH